LKFPSVPAADTETKETAMTRKYIDCREIPSEMNCTVAISADSNRELIDAAVQHAIAVHGHKDTPELRKQIAGAMKEGTPPIVRRPM
jgi:predicted small metal-binding protein